MKENLIKQLSQVFDAIGYNSTSFIVYECEKDTMPLWTKQIEITHEFLACVNCSEMVDYEKIKNKLKRFLGKEVHYQGQDNEKYIYWFEGNRTSEIKVPTNTDTEEVAEPEKPEKPIEYLKTETWLPAWLDDFIFNNLNAEYAPDFERYSYNLDLTEAENLKYLGTYFPRSYAEAFCIFDNMFQNRTVKTSISKRKELNILDVGCGTGGNLLGLLTAIEKYFSSIATINIWAIDGNKDALSILSRIVDKFTHQSNKKVCLHIVNVVFPNIANFSLSEHKIDAIRFDFVLSFKMICEIIAVGKGASDNSYYDFAKKFVPLLSDDGICVLLDVTTKQEHNGTFNPILMNRQINKALSELGEYKTLLPLSCNLYEANCNFDCFYLQTFSVIHKKHTNDKSKVAYRVIVRKSFGDTIVSPDANVRYLIHNNNQKQDYCFCTTNFKNISDTFKLTN